MTLFHERERDRPTLQRRSPRLACPACGSCVEVPLQVLKDIEFLTEIGFDGGRDLACRCGNRVDLSQLIDLPVR